MAGASIIASRTSFTTDATVETSTIITFEGGDILGVLSFAMLRPITS